MYKIVTECQGGRTASPVNVPGDDALIAPLDSGFCLVFFFLAFSLSCQIACVVFAPIRLVATLW